MRDYARQALVALEVYLERGRQALLSLERKELDKARAILQLRTAAYHNFRSLDASAEQIGLNTASDPRFVRIWEQLQTLEPQLIAALQLACEQTGQEILAVRKTRTSIAKYRSGMSPTESFTQTA